MLELYISIERLTKHYTHPETGVKFQALSGIDLRVYKGQFISIIGASGAGKTTFLNIVAGNIKPSTGKVVVQGFDLHRLEGNDVDRYRRQICGFLWQDISDNLITSLTVEENIRQSMAISGFDKDKRDEWVDNLLENFDISDRRHHKINQISGGEGLRASLATALANNPPLLVIDEPTAELDAATSKLIIEYLKKINEEMGTTIIVATHDALFETVSDLTYFLDNGTIVGIKSKDTTPGYHSRVLLMNSLHQIQIPEQLINKYKLEDFIEIVEKDNEIIIRGLDSRKFLEPDSQPNDFE